MKYNNQDISIYGRKQKQIQVSTLGELKNIVLKYLNSYISFECRYPRADREISSSVKETAQRIMRDDNKFFQYCLSFLVGDNFSEFRNRDTFPGSEGIYRNLLQRCKGIDFSSLSVRNIGSISGAPYIVLTTGQPKVIIYAYWSGRSLDIYVPVRGNWIDYEKGCVIKNGNEEPEYNEALKEFEQLLEIKDKFDFSYIRENGLLLFEYIRGSKLYGLERPESDEDHGGVYIEPLDSLLGIKKFPEEINNDTNDDSWFSLGKYSTLLLNSNPNILESLYIPSDKIIYKHPLMDILLKERDKFVTKKCFGSFIGYASTQIEKARGLKKRITSPIDGPLKSCLEFILYEKDGGSRPVIDFLKDNEMKQEYCGLVGLDKMTCNYCLYYDWGAHLRKELDINSFSKFKLWRLDSKVNGSKLYEVFVENFKKRGLDLTAISNPKKYFEDEIDIWELVREPLGYKGLVNMKDTSNQVRLSSIPKGEVSLMVVSYNKDGYSSYCRQWREYNDFEKHHNEERFNLAKENNFDRKNMTHSARLLNMGIEIARGEGVKIDRTKIDRDFLMNIRLGNTTYEEIMEYLEGRKKEMKEAMDSSTISEGIDIEFLNNLITIIRKKFYGLS